MKFFICKGGKIPSMLFYKCLPEEQKLYIYIYYKLSVLERCYQADIKNLSPDSDNKVPDWRSIQTVQCSTSVGPV